MDLRSLPGIGVAALAAALALPSLAVAQQPAEQAPPAIPDKLNPALLHVPTAEVECFPSHSSDIELFVANNGIIGQDLNSGAPGASWPRDANRRYLFGGGLWIAAQKRVGGTLKKLAVIGYNPESGESWFRPGRFDDPEPSINVNRLYLSSEYDVTTGAPLDTNDRLGPYWPVWQPDQQRVTGSRGYSGTYVYRTADRSRDISGPPVFGSSEDIVAIYNDADTSRYETPSQSIGVQVEQTVYMWKRADLKDVAFIRYRVINVSPDTLFNAYIATLFDADIGQPGNDHASIAIADKASDSLDLAVAWPGNEPLSSYGYMGIDILESPQRDALGFVLPNDGTTAGRIGLTTFRNWGIAEVLSSIEDRYDFLSSGARDGDVAAGDRREVVATGPVNLRPGDTAVVTIGLMFAYAANFGVPSGTWSDMNRLVALDRRAQRSFDSMFVTGTGFTSVPQAIASGNSDGIKVVPQPATGTATVAFSTGTSGVASIALARMDGSIVWRRDLGLLFGGDHRTALPVSDVAPGVYLITITSGAETLRGRLIVAGQ